MAIPGAIPVEIPFAAVSHLEVPPAARAGFGAPPAGTGDPPAGIAAPPPAGTAANLLGI